MLRAAELNKRVTIQQTTVTQDSDSGEETDSWGTFATRWAKVEPLTGKERWAAQQVNPEVTSRVTIRYTSGVTAKMRVLYGSRVLQIDAVLNPLERNEAMELLCTEAK